MKNVKMLFYVLLCINALDAFAQGTAFSYQGRLNTNGVPVTGLYDFQFYLRDALTAGNPVGTTNTLAPVGVTNGVFSVTLDFSNQFPGASRWLEISVRTNGGTTFTNLSPRQPLLAVPYAITASNLTGTLPASQLSGSLNAASLIGSVPPASLNAVPAASLTGNIADGQLSGNVALHGYANSFTAINSFSTAIAGGWPSPVVSVQNSSTAANASPALTLQQAAGNSVDGVLAVRSTGVGYLARFFTGNGPGVDITTNGSVTMNGGLVVDGAAANSGSLNPGANFGNGGEGIASRRTSGGNQYGLDFYTGNSSRLSISNNGTINANGLLKAAAGLVIENRTSDPASPVNGQIWLRTDL